MLDVRGIAVRYGNFIAVDGVDLHVGAGEVVGLIGPNGAGKSSLLRAVNGLLRPAAGSVDFNGARIDPLGPAARLRAGLASVPEGRGIFAGMSVAENLAMGGYPLGSRAQQAANIDHACTLFPILAERRHQRAGTLSGGQQQMLAIAMGLMSSPTMLMLDEPSLGLAPIVIGELARIFRRLKSEGLTILLVEQNAKLTCDVADRIYVMQSGRILMHDTPAVLLRNPLMAESFLSVG